jgi:tetratricopeptide (TPR) repeat protein
VLAALRRYPEAEKAYRESLALRPDEAWTWTNLADSLAAEGRGPEAEKAYLRAVSLLSKWTTDYPAGPHWRGMLAETHVAHASLLKKLNRMGEAVKAYRRAADLYEKLADDFPTNAAYYRFWRFLADTHRLIGRALAARKQFPEAERAYRRSIEIHEQGLARFPGQSITGTSEKRGRQCSADQPAMGERTMSLLSWP